MDRYLWIPTRRTSQNGHLRQGFIPPSPQQTSSRTRFRNNGGYILVPLTSSSVIRIWVINDGSTVSRLSDMNEPALLVRAANLLMDSVLAFSRNAASSSWNDDLANSQKGMATAQPGKSHSSAFLHAKTSSDSGEASNASNMTESSSALLIWLAVCYAKGGFEVLLISPNEDCCVLFCNVYDKKIVPLKFPKGFQK